jgi:beta-lactam-binding protein with PASTA domain
MRVCSSCGRENPADRDFCECGEYLRWDPTGVVQAVTPEVLQAELEQAQPAAQSPAAAAHPAPPQAPTGPANGGNPVSGDPPPPAQRAEPNPAAITLRPPEGDHGDLGATLAVGVEPGGRARVLALVRNQSGIVDNYELSVLGLPGDWWSIFPNTVYLVPYGTSGTYEQEVEIRLHPPRSAEAEARIWDLQVVGRSKAYERQVAAAPLKLGIQPFEELTTKVSPERVSGRKQAEYGIAVRNTANAPVTVALDAADQDNELDYRFTPATLEIPPGQSIESELRVKPPRRRWIGRPEEKRIQVFTKTGEEANQAKTGEDMQLPEGAAGEEGEGGGGAAGPKGAARGFLKRVRVTGPRAQVGTGGVRMTGPRVSKPSVPSRNVDLMKLKAPGGGAAPQIPLMPNQVVFRHKAWLPWWVALLIPLLILLAILLFLLLPRNVVVPEVTGEKSTFEAEKKLVKSDLKLAPAPKEKVTTEAPAGTVIGQTPAAGEKAKKKSEVEILIAVGNGKVQVPTITGSTLAAADKILRAEQLTIGQISPQPPDPTGKIESQIPAANETVRKGTPINVFFARPPPTEAMKSEKDKEAAEQAAAAASGGPVRALDAGVSAAVIAQQVAKQGIVPKTVNAYSTAKPGTVFATKPPAGTELEAGDTLTLFVSAGVPELAFDDGDDILLANSASGKQPDPVASGPQLEKDPTFAPVGKRVAYAADGQLYVIDLGDPNAAPRRLTAGTREYTDPAWAPTLDRDVLATAEKTSESESRLCLGEITRRTMITRCKQQPGLLIGRAIHWSPDGRTILAFARRDALSQQGMMRWRSKRPFSPDPRDWATGRFATNVSKPDQGVIDAALSPDGKRLAVAARFGSDGFRLYLAKPGDFALSRAKPSRVRACKIAWRPDSKQLAVIEADDLCQQEVGTLVRLAVNAPNATHVISPKADNPSFEPLSVTP